MTYRNQKFNESMLSLDEFTESFEDPSKIAALSDKGEGVRRMLEQIEPTADVTPDDETLAAQRARLLHAAEMRLYRAGLGYLVPTLRLIAANVNNRKESIWSMTKSR